MLDLIYEGKQLVLTKSDFTEESIGTKDGLKIEGATNPELNDKLIGSTLLTSEYHVPLYHFIDAVLTREVEVLTNQDEALPISAGTTVQGYITIEGEVLIKGKQGYAILANPSDLEFIKLTEYQKELMFNLKVALTRAVSKGSAAVQFNLLEDNQLLATPSTSTNHYVPKYLNQLMLGEEASTTNDLRTNVLYAIALGLVKEEVLVSQVIINKYTNDIKFVDVLGNKVLLDVMISSKAKGIICTLADKTKSVDVLQIKGSSRFGSEAKVEEEPAKPVYNEPLFNAANKDADLIYRIEKGRPYKEELTLDDLAKAGIKTITPYTLTALRLLKQVSLVHGWSVDLGFSSRKQFTLVNVENEEKVFSAEITDEGEVVEVKHLTLANKFVTIEKQVENPAIAEALTKFNPTYLVPNKAVWNIGHAENI